MSHNNLSKTVAALIFSLAIASALPALAQSNQEPKLVENIKKTFVGTTHRPMNIVPDSNAKVKTCRPIYPRPARRYVHYRKADGKMFIIYEDQTPRVTSEATFFDRCDRL